MDKAFVVQRVATKLFATEKAVDGAITEASGLLSEMLAARQDMNLSATVGADAAEKLIAALAALSKARSEVVATHEQLDELRLRLGVRTRMAGFADKIRARASDSLREAG
jgi:hypothetical protein